MARILYVEDDKNLSFVVKDSLSLRGHEVIHFENGSDAIQGFQKQAFDICIVDVMLPQLDGYSLVEQIRTKNKAIPIIFVTAKVALEDKLHGLKIGGDDYLFKPFSIEELALKIDIFMKRNSIQSQVKEGSNQYIKFSSFTLDTINLMLTQFTNKIQLTQRESDLLAYLVNHKNLLCKRGDILVELWGEDDYFLGRSLDVFISRLRKYLSTDMNIEIENVPRVGFRLNLMCELS